MSLRLEHRRLRFRLPRRAGNALLQFDERVGLDVALVRDGTVVGVGEASPLPGYSDESLESCETALDAMQPQDLEAMSRALEERDLESAATFSRALPGAARFGLESAVLEAAARARGIRLEQALGVETVRPLVPALLVDALDERDADAIVAELAAKGSSALKLKVGKEPAAELALALALRHRLPVGVELRFDANRSLRVGRDDAFLRALADLRPCLVEEPFATRDAGHAYSLGLPLALDESLRTASREEVRSLISDGRVRALVLKPTVLGLLDAVAWAALAVEAGGRALPSHTYEGPTGRRFVEAFAQLCDEVAPGLDTTPFSDPLSDGVVAD